MQVPLLPKTIDYHNDNMRKMWVENASLMCHQRRTMYRVCNRRKGGVLLALLYSTGQTCYENMLHMPAPLPLGGR
jgi:hypothetical protein